MVVLSLICFVNVYLVFKVEVWLVTVAMRLMDTLTEYRINDTFFFGLHRHHGAHERSR